MKSPKRGQKGRAAGLHHGSHGAHGDCRLMVLYRQPAHHHTHAAPPLRLDPRPLPDEVAPLLLSYLEAPALCRAASVSRTWSRHAQRDDFWSQLCLSRWNLCPDSFAPPPDPIKTLYMMHHGYLKAMTVGRQQRNGPHFMSRRAAMHVVSNMS